MISMITNEKWNMEGGIVYLFEHQDVRQQLI